MNFGRPQIPLTPEQLQRQQRLGLGLSALSDVFARRDLTTGVIAQEVMKYMPEAVTKDVNGYYMVNYGVL